MNSAARLIFKVPRTAHSTPLLSDLHWLPVSRRIEYKICTLCYNVVSGTAPPYLSELLHLYTPSRSLRSSHDMRVFCKPNPRYLKSLQVNVLSFILVQLCGMNFLLQSVMLHQFLCLNQN